MLAWDAIVLTCQDKHSAQAFHSELEQRQKSGLISERTIILTVEDPQSSVGSGGATLNALLVVAEHLSARQGFTVVNGDVLNDVHILLLHMGRNYPSDACGRAFMALPLQRSSPTTETSSLVTNFDLLLVSLSEKLAVGAPYGVWVCSSDMLLNLPAVIDYPDWTDTDVLALSVPADTSYASDHGVFHIGCNGLVEDILYKVSEKEMQTCRLSDGKVPLVAGIVFFSHKVAERLLTFHVISPLDACTYMGLDSGAQPIELSIFFDFLLAMCTSINEEKFVSHSTSNQPIASKASVENARRRIWQDLHSYNIKPFVIENGCHSYMQSSPSVHHSLMTYCPISESDVFSSQTLHHFFNKSDALLTNSVIINSILTQGTKVKSSSIVTHSHLPPNSSIGAGAVISGIHPTDSMSAPLLLPDRICLTAFHVKVASSVSSQRVFAVWSLDDDFQNTKNGTFCGRPWSEFLELSGVRASDLWGDLGPHDRCLMTAKLFPVFHPTLTVALSDSLFLFSPQPNDEQIQRWRSSCRMSLAEILSSICIEDEFNHRKKMFYDIGCLQISDVFTHQRDVGFGSLYTRAAVEGYTGQILSALDSVAEQTTSPAIAARVLANIADVLGALSLGKGGLRSGPAGNHEWAKAFDLLKHGDMQTGILALKETRRNWMKKPEHLVRAARHYEGATQILIRHAVMTAKQFISTEKCELPPIGKWVCAECPARVDIAGGWSDTPPITYEHGGAVTNAAITIDGKKPIGAKVKRIAEPHLVLVICGGSNTTLVIDDLTQLSDYSQPNSPGALLKAAFCSTDIVQFPSDIPLKNQLLSRFSGGFELWTWSNLPHGSGLGTSSILAGAVMAVLWRASGHKFSMQCLYHGVLHVEQMLTTGGGWQDQVGGLSPGVKMGHSAPQLPLEVKVTWPKISEETLQKFGDHLVLVYTGKTRLARNLLQNVIRNWYARNPQIVQTEDELVQNAKDCAAAFEAGNLEEIGSCLSNYWRLKKKMASGCEPLAATRMIAALQPFVWGISLAGAGGGGFMYVFTKEPNASGHVAQVLSSVPGTENISIHRAAVDRDGMTLTIEGQGRIVI